jgi:putative ABC transport system permease protein
MHAYLYFRIVTIGVLVSILSALVGSLFSANKATKLEPAESMRPPTPETGRHILVENIKIFWQNLSFQNKMIMRAIFRNRLRSFITIAAAIAATTLVFSAFEFLDSMYKMANFSFDEVQHQDYNLALRDPLGKDIIRPNAIIPGVKQIEGQLVVPAKLQSGPYKKNTEVTGLPQNNTLYTPVDKHGRKISISKSGLVINKTLAKILHVKVGDKITIRPLLGNRTTTRATITKTITTYLGLAAYADQTWLSRLLGNSYLTNHILFKLHKNADENKFIAAVNQFAPMINLISTKVSKQLFFESLYQFMLFAAIIMIGFAGIIAMGAILNTSMISLNERERDVASLRVLGFTSTQVAKIFFGESIILNCLGIFLGLFGGIYLAYYMSIVFSTEIYRMPVVIRPIRLAETVLIMLTFVLFSQIIIYHIIRRLNWFEVLNVKE